jgi:Zn ribbon nucleic-acid-binding protein
MKGLKVSSTMPASTLLSVPLSARPSAKASAAMTAVSEVLGMLRILKIWSQSSSQKKKRMIESANCVTCGSVLDSLEHLAENPHHNLDHDPSDNQHHKRVDDLQRHHVRRRQQLLQLLGPELVVDQIVVLLRARFGCSRLGCCSVHAGVPQKRTRLLKRDELLMRKKKRFCAFFSTVALRIDRRRSNSAIRFDKLSIQVCIHFCIASCALRSPTEQNRFLVDVFGFHHRNKK